MIIENCFNVRVICRRERIPNSFFGHTEQKKINIGKIFHSKNVIIFYRVKLIKVKVLPVARSSCDNCFAAKIFGTKRNFDSSSLSELLMMRKAHTKKEFNNRHDAIHPWKNESHNFWFILRFAISTLKIKALFEMEMGEILQISHIIRERGEMCRDLLKRYLWHLGWVKKIFVCVFVCFSSASRKIFFIFIG